MVALIFDNLPTVIVCGVVLAAVVLAVLSIVRDKKKGKSSCGCSCGTCSMSGSCHKNEK